MGSLNAYARDFEQALDAGTEFSNFNRDIQHATVIVCIALAHAQEHVRLLSNKLDQALYGWGWFLDEAKAFLGRGGNMQILVEDDIPSDHPVLELARDNRDLLSVRRVPSRSVESYKFNFMLVDDIGYRFESDRETPEAIVLFGGDSKQEAMTGLGEVFDALWESSIDIAQS